MKKTLSLLMAVLCLLTLTLPAMAEGAWAGLNEDARVEIPEMGISLVTPENYRAHTQAAPADDEIFASFGVDGQAMLDHFTQNSIYYNAVYPTGSDEIVVTMTANVLESFAAFSDADLLGMESAFSEQYASLGKILDSIEVVPHPVFKMLRITFHDEAGTTYSVQYYTIHNYQAMNFTFHSYQGPAAQELLDMLEDFVASIELL